jgi:energy-coupling factor transporter ATP-binding protein EcfA2
MHTLTIGRTGSGKTTLWKILARQLMRGTPVLVYDPIGNGYPSHFTSEDPKALMAEAKAHNHAHLIIDESGLGVGKYAGEVQWLTTQARNWGHSTHLICQRAEQLDKTVRLQCEAVYLFKASEDDAVNVSKAFTQPKLTTAEHLQQFEYLYARTFGKVQRWKVYPDKLQKLGTL